MYANLAILETSTCLLKPIFKSRANVRENTKVYSEPIRHKRPFSFTLENNGGAPDALPAEKYKSTTAVLDFLFQRKQNESAAPLSVLICGICWQL